MRDARRRPQRLEGRTFMAVCVAVASACVAIGCGGTEDTPFYAVRFSSASTVTQAVAETPTLTFVPPLGLVVPQALQDAKDLRLVSLDVRFEDTVNLTAQTVDAEVYLYDEAQPENQWLVLGSLRAGKNTTGVDLPLTIPAIDAAIDRIMVRALAENRLTVQVRLRTSATPFVDVFQYWLKGVAVYAPRERD